MPDDGHRRPKDNSKEPEEDKDQRDRVLDDFHESVSGSQEDRCRSDTDEQRKFGTNEGAKIPHAFSITVRGHERDHIHCPGVMQSAMDDRRNLLVELHRLNNGALVVAAGGHEAARSTNGDVGGSALIVEDFSFHSLGCVGLERIRCESY